MKSRILVGLVVIAGVLTVARCADNTSTGIAPPAPPSAPSPPPSLPDPIVTGISPASVEPGQTVRISGSHFGTNPLQLTVTFNGHQGLVDTAADSLITLRVPLTIEPGTVAVAVALRGAAHPATISLDVHLGPPLIRSFSTLVANPGETIEITGRNFGSRMDQLTVTFDSVAASIVSVAIASVVNTKIVVVVPASLRSGDALVVVRVGGQSSDPVPLIIGPLPSPSISAVAPPVALRGSDILVFGSNFGARVGLLSVQFCRDTDPYGYGYGGSLDCRAASFSDLSDTRLTVRVPDRLPTGNWQLVITVASAARPATANVQIL
jgi:hypothetical protein